MKTKRRYGQYFTEETIAGYMVSLISHPRDCRVLEPSCGAGVFLAKLSEKGFTGSRGYEIDPALACGFGNVVHQSFLSVPTEERYDVVIGNPPYIRWKNLEAELKEELADNPLWNRYFNSLCDYLFIFILKSIEHLDEGGELILICSDYWMNSTHSQSLRNYMVGHGYFERIYHFREAPLFEGVNASFVIFKYIKTENSHKEPISLLTYREKGKPTMEALMDESCFDHEKIPQFRQNCRWLLATEEMQEELQRFEDVCVKRTNLFGNELSRVGDVCDIGNGMVSGLDAAFRLKEEVVEELSEKERACTIPVLKAKNLGQYKFASSSRYIYMPQGVKVENFPEEYPHFFAQLQPYRDELEKRYSYGRELPYWEFAFPRSKSLFERQGAKIFVPCKERISHKSYFRFCYAPQGYYPLQDVTAIVRKVGCMESVEYILAYLNSRYVYDWLRFNGIVKGEIVEFSEAPVASIPFRKIDWSRGKEVEIHDSITEAVRNFVSGQSVQIKDVVESNLERLMHGEYKLQETA